MGKMKNLLVEAGDGIRNSVLDELESISNAYDDSKIYNELFED